MLLTEQEITEIVRDAARGSAIRRDGSTSQRIVRAIESAVIEKIKAQGFAGTYDDTFGFNCPGFYSNAAELIKDGKIDPLYRLPEGD